MAKLSLAGERILSVYSILTQEIADVLAATELTGELLVVEKGGGPAAIEEAARVPIDVLVLDVASGPGLGAAVLHFLLARPQSRVILLAPGRVPGDQDVAQVVAMGIYDVVTDLAELPEVLRRPPATRDQAALWLDPSLVAGAAKEKREIKERIVERRVPMSTRPVFLAVVSAAPGAGATSTAATLAGFLARSGYSVCLVASDRQESLVYEARLEGIPIPSSLAITPARWLARLDFFTGDFRDALVAGKYQYVVADFGYLPREEAAALLADLVIILLPLEQRFDWFFAWRKESMEKKGGARRFERVRYVCLGSEKRTERLRLIWRDEPYVFSEEYDGPVELAGEVLNLPLPADEYRWPPGYYQPDHDLDEACQAILKPVLPEVFPNKEAIRRERWQTAKKVAVKVAVILVVFGSLVFALSTVYDLPWGW